MANTHLIYRQILDISFPSKEQALNGQNLVSQIYRRDLMPMMSELFDNLLSKDDHFRIDKLEIDLGELSAHNLEDEFRHELRTRLEDELIKQIRQTHFVKQQAGQNEAPDGQVYGPGDNSIHTSDYARIDMFAFFVKTGRLPWWADRDEGTQLVELASTLISEQPDHLKNLLTDLITVEPYRKRIIHQFPDHILLRFIELKQTKSGLSNRVMELHEDFYNIHRQQQIVPLNRSNFRLLLWDSAFEYWFNPGADRFAAKDKYKADDFNAPSVPSLPASSGIKLQGYLLYLMVTLTKKGMPGSRVDTIDTKKRGKQSTIQRLIQLLGKRIRDHGIHDHLLGKMIASLKEIPSSMLTELSAPGDIDEIKKNIKTDQDSDPKADANADKSGNQSLQFEDAIEIANAGLVIIAPFLPRFFDALGLVNEDSFVTDQAAERAALILQYIAAGQTEIPEYELILNKILCGLPVEQPLPSALEISDLEKKEVENLLESVVEHWKALKSTSIEGLRNTFLIKDGFLSRDMNGWKLRIERTTVDILLDRLPWGISVIKLPWNNEILHVEW